jgi:hypothetical protein
MKTDSCISRTSHLPVYLKVGISLTCSPQVTLAKTPSGNVRYRQQAPGPSLSPQGRHLGLGNRMWMGGRYVANGKTEFRGHLGIIRKGRLIVLGINAFFGDFLHS